MAIARKHVLHSGPLGAIVHMYTRQETQLRLHPLTSEAFRVQAEVACPLSKTIEPAQRRCDRFSGYVTIT